MSPDAAPHTGIRHTRTLGWVLVAAGLVNTVAWLDSLERYLAARHHLSLDGWRPATLLMPSRWLAEQPGVQRLTAWLHPAPATPTAAPAGAEPKRAAAPAPRAAQPDRPAAPAQGVAGTAAAAPMAPGDEEPAGPFAAPSLLPSRTAGDKVSYSVLPLPPGLHWPTRRRQTLSGGPQRILFAGDSMMQGVAPLAIRELARQHPDWQMWDESRQSTGLTVKHYFDWPARIIEAIDQRQLTLVVVFLGPNDPWDLYDPGQHTVFPSPQWTARYAGRVDEILSHARRRDTRVIWIGLPSMRDGRVRDGAILQNQVFAERARAHGTDYLATEDLIGPLSRPFQRHLDPPADRPASEPAARTVNLRAEDGIHFTPAGLQRVKQALLAHLEAASPPPAGALP